MPVAVRNVANTANLTGVTQSGGAHGCAVRANQQVRCWGANDNGQLGTDDLGNDSGLPVVVHLN